MAIVRPILRLCRISNLPTVFANVLAAWLLGGGAAGDFRLIGSALAGALCYCGGMILNDVFDMDWDRRGKSRPIPEGEIAPVTAARLGWSSLGSGFAIFLALGANVLWATALMAGIVFYNGLHKRWPGSIWLMGACRFFLFITVASIPAAGAALTSQVWLWAAALAFYTAGITLAARHEDDGGHVHPGAIACLLLPAACALFPISAAAPWIAWPLAVSLAFCAWVLCSYRSFRRQERNAGAFVSGLLAGMVLVDAMALSATHPLASLGCLLLLPLNLLLQAFVPAT